jgi:hypothetical protein
MAYAIRTVIVAGTFSILHLNPSNPFISLFNVSDSVKNLYFTATDVKELFNEFEKDKGIMIEDAAVDDIMGQVQQVSYIAHINLHSGGSQITEIHQNQTKVLYWSRN